MNKRGVSPLIATVLIIGFTVALAAMIFTWGNLKESTFKKLFFSRKNDSLQQSIKKGKYPFFCKNCTSNHVEQVLWGEQKNAVE